jgi:hypothetical protein
LLTDGWALLEEDRFDFSTSLRCFAVVRRNFIREALSKNVAEMTLELQVPLLLSQYLRRHYPARVGITPPLLALLVVVDINGVLVGFIGAP